MGLRLELLKRRQVLERWLAYYSTYGLQALVDKCNKTLQVNALVEAAQGPFGVSENDFPILATAANAPYDVPEPPEYFDVVTALSDIETLLTPFNTGAGHAFARLSGHFNQLAKSAYLDLDSETRAVQCCHDAIAILERLNDETGLLRMQAATVPDMTADDSTSSKRKASKTPHRGTAKKPSQKAIAEAAVFAWILEHPNSTPTAKEIGDSVGIDDRIIRKTRAWRALGRQKKAKPTGDLGHVGVNDAVLEELAGEAATRPPNRKTIVDRSF